NSKKLCACTELFAFTLYKMTFRVQCRAFASRWREKFSEGEMTETSADKPSRKRPFNGHDVQPRLHQNVGAAPPTTPERKAGTKPSKPPG
ncbi:MAG: hypothetical protein AAB921_03080, partial [Patescibacteria group bacterium]